MECTFEVGDKITMKNTKPFLDMENGDSVPQYGVVYTVRELLWFPDGIGLRLTEIVNEPHDCCDGFNEATWDADEFRRVVDTTAAVAALAQAMREAMKKGRVDA